MTLDRFVVVDKHIVHLNFSLSKRDIFSLLKESSSKAFRDIVLFIYKRVI